MIFIFTYQFNSKHLTGNLQILSDSLIFNNGAAASGFSWFALKFISLKLNSIGRSFTKRIPKRFFNAKYFHCIHQNINPAKIYLFKVNNRNSKKGTFIVTFEYISYLF